MSLSCCESWKEELFTLFLDERKEGKNFQMFLLLSTKMDEKHCCSACWQNQRQNLRLNFAYFFSYWITKLINETLERFGFHFFLGLHWKRRSYLFISSWITSFCLLFHWFYLFLWWTKEKQRNINQSMASSFASPFILITFIV